MLEKQTKTLAAVKPLKVADSIGRAPRGLNDGKGVVFISHIGEVYPSGFLPISGGNARHQQLAEIYQNSPTFKQLSNPDELRGKCGACEFRYVCGGSRARAFAVSGDPLAEENCCQYVPKHHVRPQLPVRSSPEILRVP